LASKFVAVAAAEVLEIRWVAGHIVPAIITDIQQSVQESVSQHCASLQVPLEHFLVALSAASFQPAPQVCAEHAALAAQQLAS
jgi:hypothetical protein